MTGVSFNEWQSSAMPFHSPEKYVRKDWYEVATVSDGTMKLYFERQPIGGRKKARWWLFSIRETDGNRSTNT